MSACHCSVLPTKLSDLCPCIYLSIKSLPLRPGGAENCNITFFEGRGVKNVILQYSILRENVILQFVGTMMYHGEIKKM